MLRETQEKLILELKHYLESNETTMVDSERLNPASEYWDPARLEDERTVLFTSYPVIIGHGSELVGPADHVIDELSGTTVLAVRDGAGKLYAFLKTCQTPGLEHQPQSNTYRCPAHGTDLDPTAGDTNGSTDEPSCTLSIPIEERHGILWAIFDPAAIIDVRAFLGAELDDEFTSFHCENYELERTHYFHEKLNWKSVIDGFLENYHVRYLHGDTLAKFLRSNVHVYDPFGPHARLAVIKTTFDKVKDMPVSEYDPLKHMSLVYHVFPNSIIGWVGDHFETWTAFPDKDSARHSNTRFSLLAPAERVDNHPFWDRSMQTVLDVIPSEDFEMSRLMQQGFPAEAQTHQVFGRNEGALQHFHIELEKVLGPAN
jgi:phenylpropionate dioxygenase-like ring-hydroxylating dioxygenase large terminal subunit